MRRCSAYVLRQDQSDDTLDLPRAPDPGVDAAVPRIGGDRLGPCRAARLGPRRRSGPRYGADPGTALLLRADRARVLRAAGLRRRPLARGSERRPDLADRRAHAG